MTENGSEASDTLRPSLTSSHWVQIGFAHPGNTDDNISTDESIHTH